MPVLSVSTEKALLTAALGLGALLAVAPAHAHQHGHPRASFACAAASLPAERAICADRHLRLTDADTADLYQAAIQQAGKVSDAAAVAYIRQTQREFLQQRNACGADPGCIEGTYRAVTRQLRGYMRQLD